MRAPLKERPDRLKIENHEFKAGWDTLHLQKHVGLWVIWLDWRKYVWVLTWSSQRTSEMCLKIHSVWSTFPYFSLISEWMGTWLGEKFDTMTGLSFPNYWMTFWLCKHTKYAYQGICRLILLRLCCPVRQQSCPFSSLLGSVKCWHTHIHTLMHTCRAVSRRALCDSLSLTQSLQSHWERKSVCMCVYARH